MSWLGKLLRAAFVWWLPALVFLLVIVIGTVWWCVGSERGTRAVLGALATQLHGHADDIHGSLLGDLKVGNLALSLPDMDIEIAGLDVDVAWRALVSGRLHVRRLSATQVSLAMKTPPVQPSASSEPFKRLSLPISIAVDELALDRFSLTQDGTPLPVSLGELRASVNASPTGARLQIANLRIEHPLASSTIEGDLALNQLAAPWPFDAHLSARLDGAAPASPLCLSDLSRPTSVAAATTATGTTRAVNTLDNADAGRKAGGTCSATLTASVAGSLDKIHVVLQGEGSGLTLQSEADLLPLASFPLHTAHAALALADGSGLTADLDWQTMDPENGHARDRVTGSVSSRALDLSRLIPGLPPALLTVQADFDARMQDRTALRQAGLTVAIDPASRWNRQALSGSVHALIVAGSDQKTAGPAAPSNTLAGLRVDDLAIDLSLGRNRIKATGKLGQTASAVTLDAEAPELAAFWPDLHGAATLVGKLAGTMQKHQGELTATYVPASGPTGRPPKAARSNQPRQSTQSRALPSSRSRRLSQTDQVRQAGQANRSSLARQTGQPGQIGHAPVRVSLAFAGSWGPDASGLAATTGWRGALSKLSASHAGFDLNVRREVDISFVPKAVAPLWQWTVGAAAVDLGFPNGQHMTLAHAGSRGGAGRWQTAGRIDNMLITRKLIDSIRTALDPAQGASEETGAPKPVNARAAQADRQIALDASWDLQFAGALAGNAHIVRRSGDLLIPGDPPVPLGLRTLSLDIAAKPASASSSRISAVLRAVSSKMGTIDANAQAVLVSDAAGFELSKRDPIQTTLHADISDLSWTDLFTGDAMQIGGSLKADVSAQGVLGGNWATRGTVHGEKLRLIRLDDGVRLLDGTLSARLADTTLYLDSLRFPAVLRVTPTELRTRTWISEDPDAKNGYLQASGRWDLLHSSGDVKIDVHRYPVLQRSDRYAMVSGTVAIDAALPRLSISGNLKADAGWVSLEILSSVPTLDDDVTVRLPGDDGKQPASSPLQTSMDLTFDMGPRFYITGLGLDAGIVGSIQVLLNDGRLRGAGSLRTRGGRIEAYGQKLQLRRGTVTFQGALDNPLLDIEALRTGDQVEAGVKVVGTAQRPRITLVSYPDVDDVAKLSWLILGRAPDSGGNDAALLVSVGTALLGGGEPFYRKFGLDDVSVRSGTIGGTGSLLPDRTVAGDVNQNNDSTLATQFLVASKKFANGITLSVEQAMAGSDTVARASYQLSRRLAAELKGGGVNGLSLVYRTFFPD